MPTQPAADQDLPVLAWWPGQTGGGKVENKWDNVSTQLLTVCVDTSGDGVCNERIGLFDSFGQDYWWNRDTSGRPHIQLVFVPVSSSVL